MLAVVFDVPGMTAQQYDHIIEDMISNGQSGPKGRLSHLSFATDKGWMVVDIWESEADFAVFGEVFMPAMRASGIKNPPSPQISPVHSYVAG